jgi:hypothetical protein
MTKALKWTFSDGWILMSVFGSHGENGATLDELIGVADLINHAIPTSEELSRSLTRLASCGLLAESDGRFRIAERFIPLIAKAAEGRGGLFSTPDKGRKWLARSKFNVDEPVDIKITDKRLSLAFELYRKRFRDR